jgi:hypothetical protein
MRGEMGRWGDGEMGRKGERERRREIKANCVANQVIKLN